MDLLTFISTMTKAVIWPCLLLFVLILLRKDLAIILPALASRLRSAEFPGGKLSFADKIEKIEESPSAIALLKNEQVQLLSEVKPQTSEVRAIGPNELIEDVWQEFVEWVQGQAAATYDANGSLRLAYTIGRIMSGATRKEADQMLSLYREVADLQKALSLQPRKVTIDDAANFARLLRLIRARLELQVSSSRPEAE